LHVELAKVVNRDGGLRWAIVSEGEAGDLGLLTVAATDGAVLHAGLLAEVVVEGSG